MKHSYNSRKLISTFLERYLFAVGICNRKKHESISCGRIKHVLEKNEMGKHSLLWRTKKKNSFFISLLPKHLFRQLAYEREAKHFLCLVRNYFRYYLFILCMISLILVYLDTPSCVGVSLKMKRAVWLYYLFEKKYLKLLKMSLGFVCQVV